MAENFPNGENRHPDPGSPERLLKNGIQRDPHSDTS